MADLSVVIPTHNTAAMTLRCCQAVLASMPGSTEVIVVDDGSSDGTAALLAREAPAVRIVRLETNRGFAIAANAGVAVAQGEVILLLNSDAIVEANALRAIVGAFENEPRLGVAGARLLNEDGTLQWSGGATPTLPWMIGVVSGAGHLARLFRRRNANHARKVDWVSGAALAFRRGVWNDAGPLNERFLFYCQDIDFCLRARDAGWDVRIVEEARVTHGLGGTVSAGNPLRHDPARLWPDLLAWGSGYYGKRWAARARTVLVTVAALRVAWRKLLLRRDTTTDALMLAMRRLAQSDS
jgi:GT2 family glycosyltransferase